MPHELRHHPETHPVTLEDFNVLTGPAKDYGFGMPWLIYQFLAERHFDVIHFNDCAGEGSLALVAKRNTGLQWL